MKSLIFIIFISLFFSGFVWAKETPNFNITVYCKQNSRGSVMQQMECVRKEKAAKKNILRMGASKKSMTDCVSMIINRGIGSYSILEGCLRERSWGYSR